jgi:hypothetical protein
VNAVSSQTGDIQAIQHLKQAIAEGKHWYLALLEAIRLWVSPEEDYHERHYRYLIDNEAFDWLVLAERLCEEVDGLIPEKEQIDLLFFDRPPIELTNDEFKELLGSAKYQAYLNYLYGILVEEFLILAVTEEIRKGRRTSGLTKDGEISDEVYRRIYGATKKELLEAFRKEKGYPKRKSISVGQLKEFTYWLFKQRLKRCDKSCIASDTKKALMKLHHYMKLRSRNISQSS